MEPELKNKKVHGNAYCILLLLLLFFYANTTLAQTATKQILIDIAHGQKFWNDPNSMAGMDTNVIQRINYMTGQISKTAASVKGEVGYLKGKIQPDRLATCDLLFIHLPSAKYDAEEVAAIKSYLQNGGSLFLVMDVNYWSTIEQTGVNDMIIPFGIKFGNDSADTLSGGYTKPGLITDKKLKVTYHGARTVEGGTPFCFNNQTKEPFGAFAKIKNGGKIIAMGDGMVSLYMTSWKDVHDYQCQEFMHDAFAWLLK